MTDYSIHVDRIVIPKLSSAGEEDASEDLIVRAEFDPILDDDIRANDVIDPDLDLFPDDGASMDLRHDGHYSISPWRVELETANASFPVSHFTMNNIHAIY